MIDIFTIGILVFLVSHVAIGVAGMRKFLIDMFGPVGFRGVVSLISLLALALTVYGYPAADRALVFAPIEGAHYAPLIGVFCALFLIISAYAWPDIKRITRHPMAWGIVVFSAVHLFANGDRASVLMFGIFLFYGLLSQWLQDRRMAIEDPDRWRLISEQTSAIPFVAMLAGCNYEGDRGNVWLALAITIAVYALLIYLHGPVIGVDPIALLGF